MTVTGIVPSGPDYLDMVTDYSTGRWVLDEIKFVDAVAG